MDANHFRQRAAHAREMATSGEDPRLSQMLLEVARELDVEADSIEAEVATERRQFSRQPGQELAGKLIGLADTGGTPQTVQVINISRGGAKLRTEHFCKQGSDVILNLPAERLSLYGRIIRTAGFEAGMAFEPASTRDPALNCYLQRRSDTDAAYAAGAGESAAMIRPASNSSDRKSASPLNLDDMGRSSRTSSAS